MTKGKDQHDDRTAFAAAMVGATGSNASVEASAVDELRLGLGLFLDEASKEVDPGKLKGKLFEHILASKFNADAAQQSVDIRARVADVRGRGTATDGRPNPSYDLELFHPSDGRVVERYEAKAGSLEYEVWDLSRPKYDHVEKVVPLDQVKGVRELSSTQVSRPSDPRNYSDTASRVRGTVNREGVSAGVPSDELNEAALRPKSYANRIELRQVGREAAVATRDAAVAGALIGGAISSIRNLLSYRERNIGGKVAVANVAKDTVKAAARSASTGSLGVAIRNVASRAGVKALAKSNIATAVAAGLIETGVIVYAYAKGEITGKEAGERLGGTACGTISSLGVGAAAGSVFGPVGSIVGGIAGHVLSTQIYQSCIAVFEGARLSEEEAERVVALCDQAINVMD